jgi:8-oxo-dGTP diphosphatase
MKITKVVLCVITRDALVLAGKKSERPHPAGFEGLWMLPGGRVEGQESLEEAVYREVREETNLSVKIEENLGSFRQILNTGIAELNYFLCTANSPNAVAGDDLEKVAWLSKREAYELFENRIIEIMTPMVKKWFGAE